MSHFGTPVVKQLLGVFKDLRISGVRLSYDEENEIIDTCEKIAELIKSRRLPDPLSKFSSEKCEVPRSDCESPPILAASLKMAFNPVPTTNGNKKVVRFSEEQNTTHCFSYAGYDATSTAVPDIDNSVEESNVSPSVQVMVAPTLTKHDNWGVNHVVPTRSPAPPLEPPLRASSPLPCLANNNSVGLQQVCDLVGSPSRYGTERVMLADIIDAKMCWLGGERKQPLSASVSYSVNSPLGVTYDEKIQQWIVADTKNHRLLMLPSLKQVQYRGMIDPSAIAIYEEGVSVAFMDKTSIKIYNHSTEVMREVTSINTAARGLSVTRNGNLVTVQRHPRSSEWHVVVYSGKEGLPNKAVCDIPYEGGNSPCFLDCVNQKIVITDLSEQTLSTFYLDDDTDDLQFVSCKQHKLERSASLELGYFSYVSGVFIDNDGFYLVADADNYTMQLFDDNGEVLHHVSFREPIPYTSNFWINRSGMMAVCARKERQGRLYFYQLNAVAEKLPLVHRGVSPVMRR